MRTLSNRKSETLARINLETSIIQPIRSALTEKLKISDEKANLILLKWTNDSSIDRNQHELSDKINLLQSNFHADDISHNIQVLSMSLDKIESKINILNELAFERLEISMLYALPNLMSKSIEQLKSNGYYGENLNLLDYIVNHLRSNVQLSNFDQYEHHLRKECKHLNDDSVLIKDVRRTLISTILKQILDCSDQVAQHLIDDTDSENHLDVISIRKLSRNLDILKHQLNLPMNYVVKHFHTLINCDTTNLERLASIGQLRDDTDLRAAFFSRKRLLNIDATLIEKRIDMVIRDYGCSMQQLSSNIFILELSIDKIRENFEKFHKQPELRCYVGSREFLRLIMNIDVAINNTRLLKEKGMRSKYVSIHNILKPSSRFSTMVDNNNFKLTLNTFIQMHFATSLKEVKNKVGNFKSTTRSLNSVNAENIVNFFREQGLNDDQIINGIYLVFYDFETIQSIWPKIFTHPDVMKSDVDWKHHPNVLQLLFHLIETKTI
ncbi:hypothetical protein BLA29_001587 [Euroglyphus maynei]|uniref:Uncharacterized protein n=1 Tax=Euroglyphus maynei TaxID=6958 RepID=A0A1Y3B5B7_EURMA|nr:hypothetical protein BLA29_001587 [Euroglyphus maynei]